MPVLQCGVRLHVAAAHAAGSQHLSTEPLAPPSQSLRLALLSHLLHPVRSPRYPHSPHFLQATTNALLSHFFSLVCSLWLLRIVANRPSAGHLMATGAPGSSSSPRPSMT